MTLPRFHLVCGSTGTGKTTCAKALADRLGGVHFSIDQWMMTLFWADSPQPIQFAWTLERVRRCETQIVAIAIQCARQGLPVVLDLGFTKADSRARIAGIASEAGFASQLHHVDTPVAERWRRVQMRNQNHGETFSLEVTRPMFDFVETIWEPPSESEMAAWDGVTVGVEVG